MSLICHRLTTEYDARILDQVNSKFAPLFEEVVRDAQIGPSTNTTVVKLLQNHFKPQKPIPKQVIGPRRLTKLVKDDMTIYAFGEEHGSQIQCSGQHIVEFLEQVVRTTDCFIDLYIETHSGDHKNTPEEEGHLWKLRHHFRECTFRKIFQTCQLETARVHFTDIRDDDTSDSPRHLMALWYLYQIGSRMNIIFRTSYGSKDWNRGIRILGKISRLIYLPAGREKETFLEWTLQLLSHQPRLKKELARSTHRTEILESFKEEITSLLDLDWWEAISSGLQGLRNNEAPSGNFLLITLSMFARIMDCYTLARIFKVFKVTPEAQQPARPQNVILYFGNFHTSYYVKFLTNNGFRSIEEINEPGGSRCLNMTETMVPLFG